MADSTSETPKPARRSNAERSARSQQTIIQCAIECLGEFGYKGTTLNLVAERANLSKGAMLHQFHSKDELMLTVAQYCINLHAELQSKMLSGAQPNPDPLLNWFNNCREIVEHPTYIALIEIMMATRQEKKLEAQFHPLVRKMAAHLDLATQALAASFGIEAGDDVKAMVRVHINAFRGIAMEQMISKDKTSLDAQMNGILAYARIVVQQLVANRKNQNPDAHISHDD